MSRRLLPPSLAGPGFSNGVNTRDLSIEGVTFSGAAGGMNVELRPWLRLLGGLAFVAGRQEIYNRDIMFANYELVHRRAPSWQSQ